MSEGPARGSPSQDESLSEEYTRRAKINPIFLWASQNEQQKIIEVRCEDYDKRNRIKLTKTAYGWRSIPRTAYSVVVGNTASSKSMENQTPSRAPPPPPPPPHPEPPPAIDLENIKKSKHYQPRVVLEQLRVSRIHALPRPKNEKCPVSCCLSTVSSANNNNNDNNIDNNNYKSSRKILEALIKTPGLSVSVTSIEETSKPDFPSEEKRRRLESPESTTVEDRDPRGIVQDSKGSEASPKARSKKRASAFLERLLPSPPCSVSCSEDARNDITLKGILSTPNLACYATTPGKSDSESPPTDKYLDRIALVMRQRIDGDGFRSDLPLDPARQLKELIENTEYFIPDPLLVPRHCLPGLAAAPAIEIPKLLISRPELRLPEALSKPELLRDPDLLVISLAHLQQVLNEAEEAHSKEKISCSSITGKPKLTCKPIDTLMPSPIDLSNHNQNHRDRVGSNSAHRVVHPPPLLRVRSTGLFKQESEVSSTAGSIDETLLWHPLFGSQKRPHHQEQHEQQQQQQQQPRYHPSWHRTTLAS